MSKDEELSDWQFWAFVFCLIAIWCIPVVAFFTESWKTLGAFILVWGVLMIVDGLRGNP